MRWRMPEAVQSSRCDGDPAFRVARVDAMLISQTRESDPLDAEEKAAQRGKESYFNAQEESDPLDAEEKTAQRGKDTALREDESRSTRKRKGLHAKEKTALRGPI